MKAQLVTPDTFKCMLACNAPELEKIKFPCFGSPKIDGIRASVAGGKLLSRPKELIPNRHVFAALSKFELEGLDGELAVGKPNHPNVMQTTSSGIMSYDGMPDFSFNVYDYWTDPTVPYHKRNAILETSFAAYLRSYTYIKRVPQTLLRNIDELLQFKAKMLAEGWEGIVTRAYDSTYKFGRSTPISQHLLRYKDFETAEAEIIGFQEFMHNANELTTDNRGNAKRSSHTENKVPMNMLGAFVVKDLKTGIVFNIGTGYTIEQRKEFWRIRYDLIGKFVTYQFFNKGVKLAPRHPVFLNFRDILDMDDR